MKKSTRLSTRACAGLLGVALVASCGTGTESRGSNERTRNVGTGWAATTDPVKAVVFGTQDGLVEYVHVPTMSSTMMPTNITSVPLSAMGNTISMVAFDTARSDVIFGANTPTSGVTLSRMNIEDSAPTEIYTASSGFFYGGGYDPASRAAVFTYSDLGSLTYVINSVDEPGTTVLESKLPFYAIVNYDGSRALMTTGTNVREIGVTDPATTILSTTDITTTPFDLWGFVKDPLSDAVYGARQSLGEILVGNLEGFTGTFSQVGKAANPSSLAAFSDGTLVAGTGAALNAAAPYTGKLTIVDPTGTASNIVITLDTGSTASATGVQSVWAVESPIATAAPTISVDASGNLVCSDATWRGDLPLSRLSRAPMESARSFAWFQNGREVSSESSDTFVPDEAGDYECAAIASNVAGTGYSAKSTTLSYAPSVATTTVPSVGETTTTLEGSGGSVSAPVESPVVTVPAATPGTLVGLVTPALRSAKWTFKGRTVKVTFRKWTGARKYRLSITGATRKTITCKTARTTVTCTTTTLKKGINSFSAKAVSASGITLAISSKTRRTR